MANEQTKPANKVCFKCGVDKALSEFYRHPNMADGHLNKCKDCNKTDVRENRAKRVDYYRAYDRERGNRLTQEQRKYYRAAFPKKTLARTAVGNAVRDGKLKKPDTCQECGAGGVIHGHHDDYDKPLDVRWLCAACHRQWHVANGEGSNGG
jgi:ribosomal protein S27AE